MALGSNVQQARITATLEGRIGPRTVNLTLGVFEDRGEQSVSAPSGKYRLGSMGGEIAIGGKSSTDDITITRIMDTLALSQRKDIKALVGRGKLVITEQPLNEDEVAEGEPDVWTGKLTGYSDNGRSASGEDASQYTITCTVTTNG